jgi:hypothetical protein
MHHSIIRVIYLTIVLAALTSACSTSGVNARPPTAGKMSIEKNPGLRATPTATNSETKDEVVCRTQRAVGSHIPRRVCRTRAEMEAAQKAAIETAGPLRTMGGDELRY